MSIHGRRTRPAIAAVPEAERRAPARHHLHAVRPETDFSDGPYDAAPDIERLLGPWPTEQIDAPPTHGPVQFRLDFGEPITAEELDAATESGFSDPLDFEVQLDGHYRQVTLATDQ